MKLFRKKEKSYIIIIKCTVIIVAFKLLQLRKIKKLSSKHANIYSKEKNSKLNLKDLSSHLSNQNNLSFMQLKKMFHNKNKD